MMKGGGFGEWGLLLGTAVVMEMEGELGNWGKGVLFCLPMRGCCRRVWELQSMTGNFFVFQVIVVACHLLYMRIAILTSLCCLAL